MKPYPLQWPVGRSRVTDRQAPINSMTLAKAVPYLLVELERIGAIRIVITSFARLKKDGFPYSQQPKGTPDPGVAVWFQLQRSKEEQVCLSCDLYDTIAGNLREIGLAVNELRGFTRRTFLPVAEVLLRHFTALPPNEHSIRALLAKMEKPSSSLAAPPPVSIDWKKVLGVERISKLKWNDCLSAYRSKVRQEMTQAQRDELHEAQTAAAMHFGKPI